MEVRAPRESGQVQIEISIIQETLWQKKKECNKYYMCDFTECKSTCTLKELWKIFNTIQDWPYDFLKSISTIY